MFGSPRDTSGYLKQKNIPHISTQVGCVLGVHAGPKMVAVFALTP